MGDQSVSLRHGLDFEKQPDEGRLSPGEEGHTQVKLSVQHRARDAYAVLKALSPTRLCRYFGKHLGAF